MLDANDDLDHSIEDDVRPVKHIVTVSTMLKFGLLLFYTEKRINRTKQKATNIGRFQKKIGIHPITASTIYKDLQKTDIDEARIDNPNDKTLTFFLAALFMLKKYPKEDDLESTFDY
jgi:hypothetical protein